MSLQKCNSEDLNSVALWVLRTVIQTIIPMDRHSPLIVSIQYKHFIIEFVLFTCIISRIKSVVINSSLTGKLCSGDDIHFTADVGHPLHSVHRPLPHMHRLDGFSDGDPHDV